MEKKNNVSITILVDFDGTCVRHEFPIVGSDIGAQPVLRKLVDKGHRLILFTMRSDVIIKKTNGKEIIEETCNYLTDAVNWFKSNNIPLFGINTNPEQRTWTTSPKAYGQLIIDDIGLGIPLTSDGRHTYVDWVKVEELLIIRKIL
jgi:hypothetical protein